MRVDEHHQHADHESGFRFPHEHDGLRVHLHHRGPDYVTYPTEFGAVTYTGTPESMVE